MEFMIRLRDEQIQVTFVIIQSKSCFHIIYFPKMVQTKTCLYYKFPQLFCIATVIEEQT
jgi:hypothetical protein